MATTEPEQQRENTPSPPPPEFTPIPGERYLIGVKYKRGDPWTDFEGLIKAANDPKHPVHPYLQNSLFIYNENASQYLDETSIVAGGGNACIRPWRMDAPQNKGRYRVYSTGVPTDNFELSQYAAAEILLYLSQNPQVNKVFWSSDKGQLGLGIFAGMEEARIVSTTFPRLLINQLLTLGFTDVYYNDKKASRYRVKYRHRNGGQCFSDLPNFVKVLRQKPGKIVNSDQREEEKSDSDGEEEPKKEDN